MVDKKIELVSSLKLLTYGQIEIEQRVVEYAKLYIEYLSSVPELLSKGGSELLEKVQAEIQPITAIAARALEDTARTQPLDNQDENDNIYNNPQFLNGVAVGPSYAPKNFKVYGSKSLLYGSDFIRRLLEKPWRTRTNDQQQQSMRVINSVKAEVF